MASTALASPAKISFNLPTRDADAAGEYLEGVTLSADSFLEADFGTNHAELVEGRVFVVPPPSFKHQKTQSRLWGKLRDTLNAIADGEIFGSPTSVIVGDGSVLEPDLVWFPADHPRHVNLDNRDGTPPALVIEILSPSTHEHDLVTKRELYAKAGIDHYWIADPANKTMMGLELRDGTYVEVGQSEGGEFSSAPFAEAPISLAEVFPWD